MICVHFCIQHKRYCHELALSSVSPKMNLKISDTIPKFMNCKFPALFAYAIYDLVFYWLLAQKQLIIILVHVHAIIKILTIRSAIPTEK